VGEHIEEDLTAAYLRARVCLAVPFNDGVALGFGIAGDLPLLPGEGLDLAGFFLSGLPEIGDRELYILL